MPSTIDATRDFTDTVMSGIRKGQDLALGGLDALNFLPEPKEVVNIVFDLTKTVVTNQIDLGRTLVERVASAN